MVYLSLRLLQNKQHFLYDHWPAIIAGIIQNEKINTHTTTKLTVSPILSAIQQNKTEIATIKPKKAHAAAAPTSTEPTIHNNLFAFMVCLH
jgi:ribosome maturation protein Sdo1